MIKLIEKTYNFIEWDSSLNKRAQLPPNAMDYM